MQDKLIKHYLEEKLLTTNNDKEIANVILSYLPKCSFCNSYIGISSYRYTYLGSVRYVEHCFDCYFRCVLET